MIQVPKVGFARITAAEYHSDPCSDPSLSSSIAKVLCDETPAHAALLHPHMGGRGKRATTEMNLGTLGHELMLGEGKGYVLCDFKDWRTNAAKDARAAAEADGKVAVLPHQLDKAREAAVAWMAQLHEYGIRFSGESELAGFWQERASDGTVVQCRTLLDHYIDADGIVYEFKTCDRAAEEVLPAKMESMGYDIQAAAHVRAVEAIRPELAGRVKHRFIFAETDPPFAVQPDVSRAGSMQQLGELRWRRAVDTWARCLATNKWPGYPQQPVRVEARSFSLAAEMAKLEARLENEGEAA